MTALLSVLSWLFNNPTILAIAGAVFGALGYGWQQRRAGAKAEKAKQAEREAKAREAADKIDRQIDAMHPDAVKKELGKWSR